MTSLAKSSIKQLSAVIFLGTSGIGTLFLFFIDEGNYHFENLFALGNIIALSFYFLGIYLAQLILFQLFQRKRNLFRSIALSTAIGFPLGTMITATFFIVWREFMVTL